MKPATASSDDQARKRPSGGVSGTTIKRKFVDSILSAALIIVPAKTL